MRLKRSTIKMHTEQKKLVFKRFASQFYTLTLLHNVENSVFLSPRVHIRSKFYIVTFSELSSYSGLSTSPPCATQSSKLPGYVWKIQMTSLVFTPLKTWGYLEIQFIMQYSTWRYFVISVVCKTRLYNCSLSIVHYNFIKNLLSKISKHNWS